MKIARITAAICIALPLGAAYAEPIPLKTLADYFADLETAETTFEQTNADGSKDTGSLKIRRPGRMRFEYDPPNNALVIAGGQKLAIFDSKSNAAPQQFPLKRTPLNLILGRKVQFDESDLVIEHVEVAVEPEDSENTEERMITVVGLADPETPEAGTIRLHFSADPLTFEGWVIETPSGEKIEVALAPMETGVQLSNQLFNIVFEAEKRGLSD